MAAIKVFVGLCVLLVIGKVLRLRIPILQRMYLPASMIGGFVGLALLSFFPSLVPQDCVSAAGKVPGFLINIVFATIFLGAAKPKIRTIFSLALPQLALGQFIAWGQYVVGLGLAGFVLARIYGLPPVFGNLLEIGFEGGPGTVGGMIESFETFGWEDGIALGYTMSTVGMMIGIVLGMVLVQWAHRRGYVKQVRSFGERRFDERCGVHPRKRRPSAGAQTVCCDSIDSLAWHLAAVGLAVGVGYGLRQLIPIQGFPLFPLCMIGGVLIELVAHLCRVDLFLDRVQMERISGASLDFLLVAAIATIKVRVVAANWQPLLVLIVAGTVWTTACVLIIAPRIFRTAWFERAIAEFGQATGVTATGLMLLRTVDPENRTPAAMSFGYKQLLHEPFMGGGIWTALAFTLVYKIGWLNVFLISAAMLAFWLVAIVFLARRRNSAAKCVGIAAIVLAGTAFAEEPYQFRERLVTVHRADRRDRAVKSTDGEYVFRDGVQISVPDGQLARRAAEDLADYLIVSMGVNASALSASDSARHRLTTGVTAAIGNLEKRGYVTTTTADGIRIVASDERMIAQAFYRLEDVMNFRKGPFVRIGETRRFPIFEERITFSGYGNDIFPDAHLNQIAHAGFTRIEIWLDDYDVISQGPRQDVNDLIARAAKFGLATHFEPRNRAFIHPDDPNAADAYRKAYGRLTEYYPGASSAFYCGEVCEFPSKDPRTSGRSHRDKSPRDPSDKRPNPGWFPCSDWAKWVRMVMPMTREHNRDFKFVFSTYNWGNKDEKARSDLIAALPTGITLIPTFEMFEKHVKRNGLVSPVADYSLAFPGPGKYFASEAAQAKAAGIELWSNCNSAGLSWDFGNIPYQPAPWQWKKRWDGLKQAHEKWNLTGLRENHEYGWYPSFISELEKEYLTEGGDDFETVLRKIAERDFGAANVEKALSAWRLWSRAAEDYVPTDENQYGPCRIGSAYPYNFYGKPLQQGWAPPKDFPLDPGAVFTICSFDFAKELPGLGMAAVTLDSEKELKEIELFESQAADYGRGADAMREIAESLPEARRAEAVRQAALGTYLMCACRTTVNVKRGRRAYRKGDRDEVVRIARMEYANAQEALGAVDADSRLGWLCSSGYTGGRRQIEWKLRKMRELYGF